VTVCRTPEEAFEAGCADGLNDPPLSQETADKVAAILATARTTEQAA
jgi:hypothetical protein